MLTIPYIRENREHILQGLKIKNFRNPELIDQIIELDNERRSIQVKTNDLQAEMNRLSKEIGLLLKPVPPVRKTTDLRPEEATGKPGTAASGSQFTGYGTACSGTQYPPSFSSRR